MPVRILGKSGWLAAAVIASLVVAAPVAAQNYSDGYKFLQAIEKKEVDTASAMINRPGSTLINARDISTNRTALHIVVQRRDATWLDWLLDKGADPNLADNRGVSPLLLACRIGFMAGVERLVEGHAKVDEPNSAGETPLLYAVHRGDLDLMRVLLKAGADPDRADSSGRTARDYAKEGGAQSPLLAEIERSAQPGRRRGAAGAYGPSL